MIEATGLRWILTAVFAAAGAFCLYRCVRRGPVTSRIADVLHAVMCAAMAAMAWPATMSVARVPQLVLFGLAAGWFAVVAVRGGAVHDGHEGRWQSGYHAVMMAAMAWMVFAMPRAMVGGSGTTDVSGHHGGSAAMTSTAGSAPVDVLIVALVLAAVFCLAGIAFLARAIDGARVARPSVRTTGWGADGLMGLGTTLMLLAML
ncbi:DUF5134 domain-containing protein [Amycolatopsis sp. lyj-346]|uniref:DUF5134 domain-containing protein n=1 Tax=Amycolatopsis sp. lyj-346 TaxID=2789289 RepID=UPI00397B429E